MARRVDLRGAPLAQYRAARVTIRSLPLVEDNHAESSEHGEPVVVPYRELSEEALRGVVESFVLREGTEYGERDFSLDQKVAQVLSQLRRGEAQITFDPRTETVDIMVVRSGSVARGHRGDT